MRTKKALYNSIASISLQIVSLICGFILPRLILSRFGSSYNGITQSISQFLSVIALLRAGVGGATRASLYKSLAKKDMEQVSSTVKATELFMRKVSLIFAGFILVFAIIYPIFVRSEFNWLFSSTLVIIIAFSTFIEYYFGITYQMLFQADQKLYVTSIIQIFTYIINTALAALLIKLNFGIHIVKLGSSVAFCITPVALNIYAKHHYKLNKKAKPDFTSINQRWDAFYHQIAAFVHNNTDITLLTIFTTTKEISVYSVYYLVGNGLKKIVLTVSSGIEAAFGNMIANNEIKTLQINLNVFETTIHIVSTVFFATAFVLVTPFVKVYTLGVNDVNYARYAFGYLVILSEMLYCLRSPYESIINAAGHFKQTKKYAFTEAFINLGISLCLVYKFKLIGVVLGTLISIIYRNIVFATYISKNIVNRSMFLFVKRFAITTLSFIIVFIISQPIISGQICNYFEWIVCAVIVTLCSLTVTLIANFIFYKNEISVLVKKVTYTILKRN